jgi:hypothetical protein
MSILFTEQPLVLNVELARMIGLNEAIVLQQVDYWIKINKKKDHNFREGSYWTYNTYEEWKEDNFPFWSIPTIQRTFSKLEKQGFLISSQKFNSHKAIKTKWYTINYELLEKKANEFRSYQNDMKPQINVSEEEKAEKPSNDASYQNDMLVESNCNEQEINLIPSYTENSTETSTDNVSVVTNVTTKQFEIENFFKDYKPIKLTDELVFDFYHEFKIEKSLFMRVYEDFKKKQNEQQIENEIGFFRKMLMNTKENSDANKYGAGNRERSNKNLPTLATEGMY